MFARTRTVGYESEIREAYGERAELRLVLDKQMDELLSIGWHPSVLANLLFHRELEEAVSVSWQLIERSEELLGSQTSLPIDAEWVENRLKRVREPELSLGKE